MIQLQVLNYILNTHDSSILLTNNIDKEFFSDYVDEYNYIIDHLNKYGNIPDQASFLSKFPTFDIIEVHENPEYLLDKLYDDKNTRTLASIFNDIKNNLMSDNIDKAMEIIDEYRDEMDDRLYSETKKQIQKDGRPKNR